ncbi:MAG: TldD/PmbA family protein [Abditibacteriales bacterium]|nr:TldD/PmbA family protein [Abditibacteriales bacterium]MDW8365704.1 TldD/PmbA family protein [Abditibacteriales bacterium]
MTEAEAREILERVLSFAQADHTEVSLSGSSEASTRYANNAITQNVAKTQMHLAVRAAVAKGEQFCVGSASVNDFSDEAIRRAVARAEEIARHSAPDTEYLPPVGPQTYLTVNSFSERTAAATPDDRARVVRACTERVAAQGLNSAGSYATAWWFTAIANSAGNFAYHKRSGAHFVCTVMSDDSSGWAEAVHEDVEGVRAEAVTDIALQKALAARHPKTLEPGKYTVLLEPAAVAGLLSFFAWSLDAKAAHEGRSCFSGKEGEKIGGDDVHIFSDPADPRCPTAPFFGDGLPTRRVDWVKGGTLTNLSYSRFWAQKTGHAFTGYPTNLIMQPPNGGIPYEDLLASVERGVLVTRLWYIRFVDPMKLLLTGMTRDGLFWVERGKVAHGLKNLRFNDSPLNLLKNILALGEAVRVGEGMVVPALVVKDFHFSSGTTF